MSDPAKILKDLKPNHEYFIGIDSDGCVFDTMGIKQRECFCPLMIGYFDLQPVAEAARECKVFADLFSKTRGANRHKTIARILTELLPTHPMTKKRGFEVPQFPYYIKWVNDPDSLLSNDGLAQAVNQATEEKAKAELQRSLTWSQRVNELVGEIVKNIPPFPYVRESLGKIQGKADVIVCSATPNEALQREWDEHDIAKFVNIIAGQEMGKKAQHLDLATTGKYKENHVLMMGDAPGDFKAARSVNALFYPINPGSEAESWQRFYDEALDKFLNLEYAGRYEQKLLDEFEACLPELPPWQK
jgi:phosphoglycolate phosphatase-like HAD superfamily hydrolase